MSLQFYTREDLKKHTSTRQGEEKIWPGGWPC